MSFPVDFLNRLNVLLPEHGREYFLDFFEKHEKAILRINTLKAVKKEVEEAFSLADIKFENIKWCDEALSLDMHYLKEKAIENLVAEGKIYRQSLASLLVTKILDPQRGEDILDLCAAPGSKTSHMAAIMNNTGKIMAVEAVRNRFYKLKSVCSLLGINNTIPVLTDGRRFRSNNLFDRLLVDAPCSAEARFRESDKDTYKYWSLRKIKEMSHKQKGLILNASRFLKPGGTLVYSTCTFAPEENEEVIDWFLKKTNDFKTAPIEIAEIKRYPCLDKWGKRLFNQEVSKCMRILPADNVEGFFIAKFMRNNSE